MATLGLSLFVEGYSLGPLVGCVVSQVLSLLVTDYTNWQQLFSPLQELPSLGHNPVYITTIILFAILQIPAALSTNIAGLLVLRFLSGILGSPALTTGGATINNLFVTCILTSHNSNSDLAALVSHPRLSHTYSYFGPQEASEVPY